MRIKRFLSLLAAAAMAVTALTGTMSVSAETDSGDCGEVSWSFDSSTGKLIISGKGKMASPQEVKLDTANKNENKNSMFELGDFSDTYSYKKYKDKIIEVEIEEGVTSVGYCAFYKFPNLETVVIPSTVREFTTLVTSLGGPRLHNFAFADCTKLKNLTLTEGMTALGTHAFNNCSSLESVTIPSTLNVINISSPNDGWGQYTFSDCTSLKNITLSEGLTSLGSMAFENTAVESVVIPSTIQYWPTVAGSNGESHENAAFKSCAKLSSVTIKDGVKSIMNMPFENCQSLKKIVIPASVTDISYGFSTGFISNYETAFEEISFEDGSQLTEIGSHTFGRCPNLKALEIPENITKVLNGNSVQSNVSGNATIKNIYVYSETFSDASSLTRAENAYCYSGSKAWTSFRLNGSRSLDLEEEMSKTYDELSKAVEEANKYSEKDYTAESYGVLKALLDKAATKSEKSHVLGMRYLTEDINSAVKALVKKPAQDSVKPGAANPSTDNKITNTKSQAQKNAENAMKQAKITKLTVKSKAKKKITVNWKKVSKANGYQVQVSTNKKFKKSKIILTKTTSKKKITIKKLKSKKTYFVRVRAYATYKDSNGKPQKVYSSWIKKTRKIKVK